MKVGSTRCVPSRVGVGQRNWTRHNLKGCVGPCCKSLPSTASVQNCGRSSALVLLSSACTACSSARRKSGEFWVPWASVRRSPRNAPSSATKMACANGSVAHGRGLKKSPERRPPDRLHRRVGNQRTPHAGSHLGAQRPDAGHSVSLQLESCLGHRRPDAQQLPVPAARGQYQEGGNRRVLEGAQSPPAPTAARDLGWLEGASQPPGARVSGFDRRAYPDRFPSRVLARSESSRISLGLAQASCAGQLLPQQPHRTALHRPQQAQERAKTTFDHRCLLDAGYTLVMS